MVLNTFPDLHEAPEYYFRYMNLIHGEDIRVSLATQLVETVSFLGGISEDDSRYRYGPDKWSIRQVLGHLNDCERVFAFRAFWFARGFEASLPGFDEKVAAQHDTADERSWSSLVDEFREIRASTLSLFLHLPPEAWLRRGLASGHEFTVRAVAYIIAGHVVHHLAILRERYLLNLHSDRV